MSWNLLSFIVPAYNSYRTIFLPPQAYNEYEHSSPHPLSPTVKEIVKRVLKAENVEKLVDIKIINNKQDANPAFTRVIYTAKGPKYYILLQPDIKESFLPWVVAREVSHIINDKEISYGALTLAVSFTTALSTSYGDFRYFSYVMPCTTALGLTASMLVVAHAIFTYFSERRADDFALKHCSKQELEKGMALLKERKEAKSQITGQIKPFNSFVHPSKHCTEQKLGIASAILEKIKEARSQTTDRINPFNDFVEPSEDSRIDKIQKHLEALKEKKDGKGQGSQTTIKILN